jgi:hypothetical protein
LWTGSTPWSSPAQPVPTSARRWPPLRICRFSGALYTEGIEVAVEEMRTGLEERKFTSAEVLRVAKRLRVARVVRPYLEALQ